MQPKFSQYEEGSGAELLCPACGFNYLHHEHVEIFERGEDAPHGVHVSVKGGKAEIDTDISSNPSLRRHGLSIQFWCERCHSISVLHLSQHKGCTLVDFVDTKKKMDAPSFS